MSKQDFPESEFLERRAAARDAMATQELDWLIVTHPVSIGWLTGSDAKSYQAFQCLVLSRASEALVMLVRESERAEIEADALLDEVVTWGGPGGRDPAMMVADLFSHHRVRSGRIGIELGGFYLAGASQQWFRDLLGDALAADGVTALHDLRMVKSAREIAYVREANRIADLTVGTLRRELRAGRAEQEVAAEIWDTMFKAGAGFPPTAMNFVSGERASFSHGAPTTRRLRAGDTGNAEYCVAHRRYTASVGRQFCIGVPSRRAVELFTAVRAAGDACMAAIRDGVPASVPAAEARRVLAAAGLDGYQVHLAGYGLAPGFPPAAGEILVLTADSRYVLKAGMVLSVCPNVFIGAEGIGARLVDNVLVTEAGSERLSGSPRDLIVAE